MADQIQGFLKEHDLALFNFEIDSIVRVERYLRNVGVHPESSFSGDELSKDLKSYLNQYDQRRHKSTDG